MEVTIVWRIRSQSFKSQVQNLSEIIQFQQNKWIPQVQGVPEVYIGILKSDKTNLEVMK